MSLDCDALRERLDYDPDTGVFRHRVGWGRRAPGSVAGSLDSRGYLRINLLGKYYRAHRLALAISGIKVPKGSKVDHINGDKTDNRLENLRICDHAGNMKNRRKSCGSSRYKGVTVLDTSSGREIRATIRSDGVTYRLGRFSTEIDAAMAYDEMSKKLHGEFGCTNRDLGLL